jgi:hypothetical protein
MLCELCRRPSGSFADFRWQIYIDACRQGLQAIHHDVDDINNSFNALREISLTLAAFSDAHPDLLASSNRGDAAVSLGMLTFVALSCSPDFEQLAQSSRSLKALRKLTLVAHRSFLPGESPAGVNFGSPERRVQMRLKFLEAVSNLPPATGETRHMADTGYKR